MKIKTVVAIAALVCVVLAPIVIASEGMDSTSSPQVVGDWEFKSHFDSMTWSATMTITKNAEGKYSGIWSAQFGEGTLSDFTFEKGALKFVQTSDFGGQQMKTTYEATVEGTKIKGKGKNQFGESVFEGTLSAAGETSPKGGQGQAKEGAGAIVGTWEINNTVPAREVVDKLTITKNADGTLSGNWISQRGENTISNVKFEAGKLTFTRTGKMGAMEFTLTFEGTVEGDTIKGVFHSDFGDRESNATRITAVKPAEPPKGTEPNKP